MKTCESESVWIARWRAAEDRFFRSVMADPQLYMDAIRFVRAIADEQRDVADLGQLVSRFEQGEADELGNLVETLEAPKLILLDFALARGAAFHLRAKQLREERFTQEAAGRLASARHEGLDWATLWHSESTRNGHVFYDRLEVRTVDGEGWHISHGLDLEAGWIYSLEPVRVDIGSGEMSAMKVGSRLDFANEQALEEELARQKAPAVGDLS